MLGYVSPLIMILSDLQFIHKREYCNYELMISISADCLSEHVWMIYTQIALFHAEYSLQVV